MTKDILKQYADLRQEEKDIKSRMQSINDQILNLEMQTRIVSDTVTCGKKGKKPLRTVKIQGIDQRHEALILRKKGSLRALKVRLEEKDAEILEIMAECEQFIAAVDDSWMRQIIRHRCIDGLTWAKTANKMHSTEDSIRMAFNRFMEEN